MKRKEAVLTKSLSLPRVIAIILLLIAIVLNAYYQVLNGFSVVLSSSIIAFFAVTVVFILAE